MSPRWSPIFFDAYASANGTRPWRCDSQNFWRCDSPNFPAAFCWKILSVAHPRSQFPRKSCARLSLSYARSSPSSREICPALIKSASDLSMVRIP